MLFVANVNNSAKLQESYFNGIIYIYNTENSHTGYVLNANSTVQNNYVKGQINSYYQNENISGLVSIIYSNAQIINNYVATEFNLTSGNTRFIYSIDTSATNYTVTKNYYLVDTTSTPKIGIGLTNTTTNSTTDVTENIIQISSSDLRNQNKFKNESTWDFDDIWIYVNHINWDYPVLRSIFGGDTTDIEVTIYNPYKYGDDNTQLGNLSLDSNNILYINSTTNKVESLYGDIVDSQEFTDTSELKFTYSIITNEVGNFIVSNTSNGLITSVLFGELNKAGTKVGDITLTDDQTNYTEYATTDNADVVITQNIDKECYGLVITFNERIFNVTVNATLTADTGTDGVQDSDYMTILLVHKNSSSIVDWAYSVNLHNNQSFKFENIYNGIYDITGETNGVTTTADDYGTYEIYIFYPMYYLNNSSNTYVTFNKNVSHNPTLNEDYKLAIYTQYDLISTINTSNCNVNSLGSFTLDTITRDVEFSITINKPYEYYLHHSATSM